MGYLQKRLPSSWAAFVVITYFSMAASQAGYHLLV